MSNRRLYHWTLPVLAAAATLLLIAGFSAPVAAQSAATAATVQPTVVTQSTLASLTADEESGLLFMFEEEKLAHDLYVALGEAARAGGWALPVFDNIARAEAVHSNAVLRQLTAFGVDAPAAGLPAGEFLNDDLQALYNALLAQGINSAADALAVGALVEETDIADLDARNAATLHPTIERVYTQLRSGSTHHLQAFVGLLDRLTDRAYAPQVLTSGDYEAALKAPHPGRHGK